MESWREVEKCPGYFISTLGRIKMKRGNIHRGYVDHLGSGYKQVVVYNNEKKRKIDCIKY